jgi:hypothetical protein
MTVRDDTTLRGALARLESAAVVPAVAGRLATTADRVADSVYESVLDAAPAYAESGNPDVLPELKTHLHAHVAEVCRLLGGGLPGDFEFVRAHARRRAEQKFPLDAILQAYRVLHKSLSEWVRDAALEVADESAQLRRVVAAVTDFTIEYAGGVGTMLTSEYVYQTRRLAEADADRRSELLNMLLDGYDETAQAASRLLRRAGYLKQRQSYCVAMARSVDPREMESAARAQRMADSIADALATAPVRTIIGIRENHVFAVISATRRQSGWTAPRSTVAEMIYPELKKVGPAALIGLSNDVPSTSHIPRATNEARLALDFATVARRVMRYSRISLRQMILAQAQESVQVSLPSWFDAFTKADRRGTLAATLRAYADCDMNLLKTAKSLEIHPNTIYARMGKIAKVTGLDAQSFHSLNELLLALDCRQ